MRISHPFDLNHQPSYSSISSISSVASNDSDGGVLIGNSSSPEVPDLNNGTSPELIHTTERDSDASSQLSLAPGAAEAHIVPLSPVATKVATQRPSTASFLLDAPQEIRNAIYKALAATALPDCVTIANPTMNNEDVDYSNPFLNLWCTHSSFKSEVEYWLAVEKHLRMLKGVGVVEPKKTVFGFNLGLWEINEAQRAMNQDQALCVLANFCKADWVEEVVNVSIDLRTTQSWSHAIAHSFKRACWQLAKLPALENLTVILGGDVLAPDYLHAQQWMTFWETNNFHHPAEVCSCCKTVELKVIFDAAGDQPRREEVLGFKEYMRMFWYFEQHDPDA